MTGGALGLFLVGLETFPGGEKFAFESGELRDIRRGWRRRLVE
jgi:hypothetical protein